MSKKPIIGGIILVAIIGVVFVGAQINPDNPENLKTDDSGDLPIGKWNKAVFYVRLADSSLYENGVYSEMFQIEKGVYKFRFVPNGDSPQKLSIKLFTESFDSSGNAKISVLMDNHFELEGTLIDNGISSWYTWDYLSNDNMLKIDESQQVKILISPNGNLKGPVSIGIVSIK